MQEVRNCRLCGSLFIKKPKDNRDLCDRCLKAQSEMLDNIQEFVDRSETTVTQTELMEQFNIPLKEFELLYLKGKFIRISNKLLINCKVCHAETPALGNSNMVCPKCAGKIEGGFESSTYL